MRKREISSYSTKELLSKWASLASFIVHYEGIKFEAAKKKAIKLFEDKEKALAYIDSKRTGQLTLNPSTPPKPAVKTESAEPVAPTVKTEVIVKPKRKKAKKTVRKSGQTIFHQNYKRLLKIAPKIEEHLINGKEISGVSTIPSLRDFSIDWLLTEEEGLYHLALSQFSKRGKQLVENPMMHVLLDINKETLRVLIYRNESECIEAYDDPIERNSIHLLPSQSLNEQLGKWLINLNRQKHKVEWKSKKKDKKPIVKPSEKFRTNIEFGTPIVPSRKERAYEVRQLFDKVYTTLKRLLPKLNKKLRANEVDGVLTNKKDDTYDLVPAEPYNTTTYRFGINENKENGISLIVSVNLRNKRAWLTFSEPDFIDDKAYKHEQGDLFSQEVETANTFFLNWLKSLIKDKYKVKWSEEELAPNSPQKEGEVKLTNRHIKAGFKQKHIDWINKHKKGLVLVVKRNVINNTKNIFADLAKKAMRAGKRISRTGVIYYEGRSNHADVTGRGI